MKLLFVSIALFGFGVVIADDEGLVDFTDRATPVCKVAGLSVPPPPGWINAPIDAGDQPVEGCQMMLIEDEAIIGMLRLLSVEVPEGVDAQQVLVGIEAQALVAMNYVLGDALWRKDDVPVAGADGFGGGRAIGVALSLPGNDNALEGHFLTFHGPQAHYILTLLTPARAVDDGRSYGRLTQGLATVMQTLQPRPGDHED